MNRQLAIFIALVYVIGCFVFPSNTYAFDSCDKEFTIITNFLCKQSNCTHYFRVEKCGSEVEVGGIEEVTSEDGWVDYAISSGLGRAPSSGIYREVNPSAGYRGVRKIDGQATLDALRAERQYWDSLDLKDFPEILDGVRLSISTVEDGRFSHIPWVVQMLILLGTIAIALSPRLRITAAYLAGIMAIALLGTLYYAAKGVVGLGIMFGSTAYYVGQMIGMGWTFVPLMWLYAALAVFFSVLAIRHYKKVSVSGKLTMSEIVKISIPLLMAGFITFSTIAYIVAMSGYSS